MGLNPGYLLLNLFYFNHLIRILKFNKWTHYVQLFGGDEETARMWGNQIATQSTIFRFWCHTLQTYSIEVLLQLNCHSISAKKSKVCESDIKFTKWFYSATKNSFIPVIEHFLPSWSSKIFTFKISFLIDMTHWLLSKLRIHSFFLVSKSKNKYLLLFASVASKESQRNHVTKSNELVCLLGVNGRKETSMSAKDRVRLDNLLTR